MDPKAAAKSKRQQSHQGKRNHPTPSAVTAHKKKEPPPKAKQPQHGGAQPRSRRHHHQNLPSNWDRYDDDESVIEAEEGGSHPVRRDARVPVATATQPLADRGDTVAPKSKGADFRYLLEQARSQPRECGYGDGGLSSASLDDETVPDFAQGLMSLVSVKGESLLSWCSNDNFTVDNDTGSSFEVPYLSMDFHALAEQLSKLNMAQRLFIEEDILPTKLDADRLNKNDIQRFGDMQTQSSSENKHCLVEDAFPGVENEQVADGQSKSNQSKSVGGHEYMQIAGKEFSRLSSQGQGIKKNLNNSFESLELNGKRQSGDLVSSADMNTVQDSATRFEAALAEAELDRLLDSLGGTNDSVSSGLGSDTSATNNAFLDRSKQESSSSSKAGTGVSLEDTIDEILGEGNAPYPPGVCGSINKRSSRVLETCDLSDDGDVGSSRPAFGDSRHAVSLEKSIDDLLAETSLLESSRVGARNDGALKQNRPHGSSLHMDAPYLREDHDPRHTSALSIDETIDDLLAGTSSDRNNQEHSPHEQGKFHVSYDKPTSVSKALDDFETWLDSI